MAVTVTLSADKSYVQSRETVTVTALFDNTGADAVTVASVDRLSPTNATSVIEDAATMLGGLSLPAGATTEAQFHLWWPVSTGTDIYSLQYVFGLSDKTLVTPTANPQVTVIDPNSLTSSEKVNFPTPGQLNFAANQNSALLGAA